MAQVEPLSGLDLRVTINALTEPYWNATREGRLLAAKCASCDTFRMPFLAFCPNCNKQEIEWLELTKPATIYSSAFYPHPEMSRSSEGAMLAPAVVVFEEAPGIRYAGNLAGIDVDQIQIGMPVTTSWIYNQEGWGFPVFTPVKP